jgi:hypothetical protein
MAINFAFEFDKTGKLTLTFLALVLVGLPMAARYGRGYSQLPAHELIAQELPAPKRTDQETFRFDLPRLLYEPKTNLGSLLGPSLPYKRNTNKLSREDSRQWEVEDLLLIANWDKRSGKITHLKLLSLDRFNTLDMQTLLKWGNLKKFSLFYRLEWVPDGTEPGRYSGVVVFPKP